MTTRDVYMRVLAIQSEAFVDDDREEDLLAKLGRVYLLATGLLEALHDDLQLEARQK